MEAALQRRHGRGWRRRSQRDVILEQRVKSGESRDDALAAPRLNQCSPGSPDKGPVVESVMQNRSGIAVDRTNVVERGILEAGTLRYRTPQIRPREKLSTVAIYREQRLTFATLLRKMVVGTRVVEIVRHRRQPVCPLGARGRNDTKVVTQGAV